MGRRRYTDTVLTRVTEEPTLAGPLNIDSVGLLALTQDGQVAKQLICEDTSIEKEYLVRVQYSKLGKLHEHELQRLNHGLTLDDKKRPIRRMCEIVGIKVIGLKCVRISRVRLDNLPVGQWRYLKKDESI